MEDIAVKFDEDGVFDSISKRYLYSWLEKSGYDWERLKVIFDQKKIDGQEQNKFNNIIQTCKKETGIEIHQIVLYFEDDLFKLKRILNILDQKTKNIIKNELGKKHSIKIETNSINDAVY